MTDRNFDYRISLSNDRALAALREFASAIRKTDREAGSSLGGMKGGLDGVVRSSQSAASGLGAVGSQINGLQSASLTWTQFVKQRMGPLMREFQQQGLAHAEAHTRAIRQIGQEWQRYKGSDPAATVRAQGQALGAATKHAHDFAGGLRSIAAGMIAASAVMTVLDGIRAALTTLPTLGINFTRSMEAAELGMAGILTSMTSIDGRALSLNQALGISRQIIAGLNQDALATAATSQELITAFQGILGPALAARMTLDQVRQLTVVGVNAVKSLGLQSNQVVQELRDLVQGGITPASSTLATALGISNADIQRAKDSSEGLFAFLMNRMRGFEAASARFGDTFDGRLAALQEGATRAADEGFRPLFAAIKEGLGEATDAFVDIEREGDKVTKIQLNPAAVQSMRTFAQGLVDLGQSLASAARFLIEHRGAVLALAQAYGTFLAFRAVRGILVGIAEALASTTGFLLGGTAAQRAATAASLADLRAKVAQAEAIKIHAAMLVAEAQAAVTAATGMQRLALVQNLLIPAQQRAAAAATAHTAALGALNGALGTTGAAGLLSRLLGFLGGPLGIIALVLTGVGAWAAFGSAARSSLDGIDVSAKNASERIKQLKKDLKFGTGELGDNKAARDALQRRIAALESAGPTASRELVQVAPGEQLTRIARDRELKLRREQLAQQEELGRLMEDSARRQADEAAAGLPQGTQLQNKFSPALQAFSDLVKQYRGTAQKAGDDIREINEAFAKAVAETPELQKANAKFDPKRLADVERARNAAIAEARKRGQSGNSSLAAQNAAERAELEQLKVTLDQELALQKDALDFAKTENERAYRDGLTAIEAYHAERLRLVNAGLDAEKARNEKRIADIQAEQARLDSLKPKNDTERLQIQTASTRLENEVITLNGRNLKLEQDRTQAIRDANAEREKARRLLEAQAIDVEVDVSRAAGTLTRDQIEQQVRTRNRDLIEQSKANPGILKPEIVETKIQIEIDQGELDQVQRQIAAVFDTLETQGRSLELAGFEGPALEMALRPAREAAQTQLYGLIPQLEALSGRTFSVDVKTSVDQAKAKIEGLAPSITNLDVVAKNAAVNGFGQLFTDIATGTKKAGDAVDDFVKNIGASMLNVIGQKLGEKLFSSLLGGMDLFGGIGSLLGFSGGGAVKKAEGGHIRGPGTTTSDSIPAWLSDEEYVVKASSVRNVGVGFLDWINRGGASVRNALAQFRFSASPAAFAHRGAVARFAGGGLVTAPSIAPASSGMQVGGPTVLDFRIAPEAMHMTLRDWFEGELARIGATR